MWTVSLKLINREKMRIRKLPKMNVQRFLHLVFTFRLMSYSLLC